MSPGIGPVRFVVELPTTRVGRAPEFVTGDAVAQISRAAEDAGYAAVYVTDHPAADAKWLETGGHHALDPFVALSFAAAATSTLRLLTYVYIAAYRNPFLTAKAVSSLDVLSGGRLILGTAAGYLRPEFGALGVDFDERNELLEEALEVMQRVWSGDDVAFQGRHFKARGVRLHPLPSSPPPVWMGGNSTRAIRRAVESCDGWAPFRSAGMARGAKTATIAGIDDLAERIEMARAHAAEIGREAPLDICYSADAAADTGLPMAERRDHVARLADLGVTWVTVSFPAADRQGYIDDLRRFADDIVVPAVG